MAGATLRRIGPPVTLKHGHLGVPGRTLEAGTDSVVLAPRRGTERLDEIAWDLLPPLR